MCGALSSEDDNPCLKLTKQEKIVNDLETVSLILVEKESRTPDKSPFPTENKKLQSL